MLRVADDNSIAGDTQRRQTRRQQHLRGLVDDHPIQEGVPTQVISDRVARRRHDRVGREKRLRFGMYLSAQVGYHSACLAESPGEDRIEDAPRPTPIRCTRVVYSAVFDALCRNVDVLREFRLARPIEEHLDG